MIHSPDFQHMLDMERSGLVRSRSNFEPHFIPGMAQSPDYALAVAMAHPLGRTNEAARDFAEARTARLARLAGSATLRFTMHEGALRGGFVQATEEIMAGAIQHMKELTKTYPDEMLQIRVIPESKRVVFSDYAIVQYEDASEADIYVGDGGKRLDVGDSYLANDILAVDHRIAELSDYDTTQDLLRQYQ